jgi:hypothetical protein
MHKRLLLVVAIAALGALVFGGVTLASSARPAAATATPSLTPSDAGQPRAEAADSEPATEADAAAQATACASANIDPNGDNVQFDEATGVCTADNAGAAAATNGGSGGQSGDNP